LVEISIIFDSSEILLVKKERIQIYTPFFELLLIPKSLEKSNDKKGDASQDSFFFLPGILVSEYCLWFGGRPLRQEGAPGRRERNEAERSGEKPHLERAVRTWSDSGRGERRTARPRRRPHKQRAQEATGAQWSGAERSERGRDCAGRDAGERKRGRAPERSGANAGSDRTQARPGTTTAIPDFVQEVSN